MTRFNIGGQYLELPRDFKLQFTKKNILFAFDDIECERSMSFDIPATPTNEHIFSLASDYHTAGNAMRMRFDAEMQDGVVSKAGYLYIDSYGGGSYKAIFVTGELFGLLNLRELGTIREILAGVPLYAGWTEPLVLLGDGEEKAVAGRGKDFANISHIDSNGGGRVVPSYSFDAICDMLTAAGVETIQPQIVGNRIFLKEPIALKEHTVHFKCSRTVGGTIWPYVQSNDPAMLNPIYNAEVQSDWQRLFTGSHTVDITMRAGTGNGYNGFISYIEVQGDIEITFPNDFPDDWHILTGHTCTLGDWKGIKNMTFLGGYGMIFIPQIPTPTIIRVGTPLKGRTVSVPRGTKMTILAEEDLTGYAEGASPNYYIWHYGFRFQNNIPDREFDATIKAANSSKFAPIHAEDNFPDIAYIDWQKTLAILNGKVLYYDDATGLSDDDLNFGTYPTRALMNVISVENMVRHFGEYAQHNTVQFKDGLQNIDYTQQNDNIEADKELYTIPMISPLDGYTTDTPPEVSIALAVDDDYKLEEYAIGAHIYYFNYDYLRHFVLAKNNNLQTLLTSSTTIEVTAKMTLLEYEQIAPKMRIYYDACYWVWTEVSWDNGVAKLVLSKIE